MKYNRTVFPIQKLPLSKKTEEWKKACVDYVIGSGEEASNGMSLDRFTELQSYYDLYNSIYNERDLKYVTNPFKVDDGFPATPQDYNIIRPKINLLLGEETKRPFNFKVARTSQIAASELQDKMKQMIVDYINATVMSKLSPEDQVRYQEAIDSGEIMTPEAIQEYMTKNYKDIAESVAYHSLRYLYNRLNLDHVFMKGWEDGLIAGEEIYYIGIQNGEPFVERVNPLYFSYDLSPDLEFIEDGDWCCRRMRLSYTEIYDRFYDKLDQKQLDELLDMVDGKPGNYGIDKNMIDDFTHIRTTIVDNPSYDMDSDMSVNVWHACWRSLKKIGFVSFLDENGEVIEQIVDETYKPTGSELNLKWDWVVEVWEGYRAGDDLYFGMQPIEYQHISSESLNSQKLPYTGAVYSNNNSSPKSLVSIMKPLQYMYIILWYRLELALARDKGKVINMDVTQIPKSMGISVEKWMHYLSSLGVNFINPYDEGWDIPGREGGKCHIKGTKILMADGTIKNVEDIKLYDRVMGPDGKGRTVLQLHNGTDDMYRIIPSSGGNIQIVNSRHEIYYGKYNKHTGKTKFETATPIELMLKFRNNPRCRDKYFLYRSNGLEFKERELPIDPYFVGLWLGDGTRNKPCITTADTEIINYLNDFAFTHGMKLRIEPSDSKAVNVNLIIDKKQIIGYRNKPLNYVIQALKKLNIYCYKDIPDDCIYNSRENRLKILAGLLDSDGHYDSKKNRFTFSQVDYRKHIADKFAFIARSLGMKVSIRYKKSKPSKLCKNVSNGSYVVSILSGCENIPTKIIRKQAHRSKFWAKDTLRSMFKVEYYGKGEYYGFTLDKDNLFLLDDFTICHNSATFNQITSLDLTMSNVIAQYIQLMDKIEQMVSEISGITQQRQGAISSNELVGNVERSVVQSANITEPLFWVHNQCKKHVISMLLNTAKAAWSKSDRTKLHYIFDDATRAFLTINDDFYYEDMDIFVTDSTKEQQNIESLRSLSQAAMQNGASLLDIAEIITTDNMSLIKQKLADIEDKRMQQQEQMAQAEQQRQAELVQLQNEVKQQELDLKQQELEINKYKIDEDNATRIAVAEISAYGYADNANNDTSNEIALAAEQAQRDKELSANMMDKQMQLAEKQRDSINKQITEKYKVDSQKELEREKIKLEEKKLKAAKELQKQKDDAAFKREQLKAKTALSNPVAGENKK